MCLDWIRGLFERKCISEWGGTGSICGQLTYSGVGIGVEVSHDEEARAADIRGRVYGMSYSDDISPATMTVEQLISDAVAVTQYLRRRFDKQKIYLMGHSGGTFIGLQVAQRHPELYEAYVGVAQTSYQLESAGLAYAYMLEQFQARNDVRMLEKLVAAPVTLSGGTPMGYLAVRHKAVYDLGIGTMREMRSKEPARG